MRRRIGLLLTGCGCYDGTDPHEAVLAMLAIQQAGHELVALTLDSPQFHVVDHTTGVEAENQQRLIMTESARLVRGKLHRIADLSPKLLDGIIIPGGQGAAKNVLRAFAPEGQREMVEGVASFLLDANRAGAVIGAISLAEFVVSAVFGPWPENKGCFDLAADEVLVDRDRRLLLTPGYTVAISLVQLQTGISHLCAEMWKLLDERDRGL